MRWLIAALVVYRIFPLSPRVNAIRTAHKCSSLPTGLTRRVSRPALSRDP
jgi:hypothetical protein